MRLCQGFSQHCCDPKHPLPVLAHPNPSSPETFLGLCSTLEVWQDTDPCLGVIPEQILSSGQGCGLCCCPDPSACISPSAPEPTVEEKLQKLHSEIKFALKVDNPVSAHALARPGTSLLVPAWL